MITIVASGLYRQGPFWRSREATIKGAEWSPARVRRGHPLVVLAERGSRVKIWLVPQTPAEIEAEVNGQKVTFDRGRGDLWEASLEMEEWTAIRDNSKKKPRVAVKIDLKVPEESPAANARQKASDYYRRTRKLDQTYYFLRKASGVTRWWQTEGRAQLEARVEEEKSNAQKWLDKYRPLAEWWKSNVVVDKDQFQKDVGFLDWDDYHPPLKSGRASYKPKELYRNKVWQVNHVGNRLINDVKEMERLYAIATSEDWQEEIEEAVQEIGLVEVEDSDTWDDGFMWFHHPENPGVLFPLDLTMVHFPRTGFKWSLHKRWGINKWAVKQVGDPSKTTQEKAYYYLGFVLGGSISRVGTGWNPRNRFLSYVGGYDQNRLEVHYRGILKWVKRAAEKTPPPLELPGITVS